jgi:N-acetyl-gamma-glutamyl-phosphate reductase
MSEIINSKRIANPGCFAGGIISILNPIKDYLNQNMPLTINGVTGYSAGGEKTIQKQKESPLHYRVTNLFREHIHTLEVKHWLNLKNPLAFTPSVASFERGQLVSMTLFQEHIDINLDSVVLAYQNHYQHFNSVTVITDNIKMLIPENMANRDDMEIYINKPSQNYITIHAIYDNLGKGSSGSITNIIKNIMQNQSKHSV